MRELIPGTLKSTKNIWFLLVIIFLSSSCENNKSESQASGFDRATDLLLVQFDCKTDVDDLHTVAAFATLLSDSNFIGIKYHAVAGTYGIQDGLYVPPNTLFQLAFGDNWTDAHNNLQPAVKRVMTIIKPILENQGDIWIAEAGQSNFTAALIKAIQNEWPQLQIEHRIHVIQHSDWNEQSTAPESLAFVKINVDYRKIPDGNVVGNGTPGFRDPEFRQWKEEMNNPMLLQLWQHTIDLANQYNGKEGRYLNEAIAAGGLDFSDLSEVCWILSITDLRDTEQFFEQYAR